MTSCSNDSVRRCRPLLGTFVEVTAWGEPARLDRAVDAAFAAVTRVQTLMSFHDPASELSCLNREAACRAVTVDAWTSHVLATAKEIAGASDGAFDPTVAPVLQRWGLLPDLPLRKPGGWRDLELLSGHQVRFGRPLTLDLGGIAKGFAVDCAVAALQANGAESGLVNAGGDLRAFGPRAQPVQLRDPGSPGRLAHGFRLQNAALATSAPTFSRSEGGGIVVSHLVDPATGSAFVAHVSVSVRAPTCLLADALTKVVFFGGPGAESVLARYDAEAFVLAAEAMPLAA